MIVDLLQSGQSVKQVRSAYALNGSMIRKWRKLHQTNTGDVTDIRILSEDQRRLKKLEKELREVNMDRDILKKAVSIFSKSERAKGRV